MKIAVTGKGGVGKTFIAGALAAWFAGQGHPVIALDADPAPNLGLSLGLSPDMAATIVPVAEDEDLIRLKTGTGYPGVFRLAFSVDDIIRDHTVPTPAGPGLMVMGAVRAMGSGCTCPAHTVMKALLRHLIVERDEIVILDMEAGTEHLGRGTAGDVDLMLLVSDANRRSLEVARSIGVMAEGSAVRTGLVANRMAGPEEETAVRAFAERNRIPVLAMLPFDAAIAGSGVSGEAPDPEHSPALRAVAALAARLLEGSLRRTAASGR